MTALRVSQLGAINVLGGVSPGLRFSQLAIVAIANPPIAAGVRFSQLVTIAVIANGKSFVPLPQPVQLNCWTPCGTLLWNGV